MFRSTRTLRSLLGPWAVSLLLALLLDPSGAAAAELRYDADPTAPLAPAPDLRAGLSRLDPRGDLGREPIDPAALSPSLHRIAEPMEALFARIGIRELTLPSADTGPAADTDEATALAVAQARADWEWGSGCRPGSMVPLCDPEGRVLAWDVDFTLDGTAFGSYRAVAAEWDEFVQTRARRQAEQEEKAGAEPAPLDWGSPRYGSVTVSAIFEAPPLRGTRRGVSNVYANGWRASAVASAVLGVADPAVDRILLTGSWERLYAFSSAARRIYVQGQEPFGWFEADEYDAVTAAARAARLDALAIDAAARGRDFGVVRDSLRAEYRAAQARWLAREMPSRSWHCISGYNTSFVPYRWYAGCSPTAGSMVLNYYDETSSYGRITYYYQRDVCPVHHDQRCHVSDAQVWMPVAMGTDENGDTWTTHIYPGLLAYANDGCGYNFSGGIDLQGGMSNWYFNEAKAMIDGNHPFVWSLFYYPGIEGIGHSAACVGYDTAPDPDEFVCFNTWQTGGTAESVPSEGGLTDQTWLHGPLPGGGTASKVEIISPDGNQAYNGCTPSGTYQEGTTASVTWSVARQPAASVDIHFTNDGGDNWYWVVESTADDGSYAWTIPLDAGPSDSCRVRIFQFDAGGGLLSADGSYGDFAITATPVLPAPTLVAPPNGASGQPVSGALDWSDVPGAAGYRIQAGTACGEGSEFDVPASPSSANYSGLTPGETYWWRVRTRNGSGEYGEYSSCFSFTTGSCSLAPPSLLSPADGATCQAASGTLDWGDVTGASGYTVQLGTSCGTGAEIDVTASNYPYSGLTAGQAYWWRVRSRCPAGDYGAWSACRSFSVTPPTAAVPTLASPANGATGLGCPVTLDWGDVTWAVAYEVRVGASCGSGNVYATTASAYSFSCQPNLTYWWQVRARNACSAWSAWSGCRSFSTAAGVTFRRGDDDASGEVNISDPISSLQYQFAGGSPPPCFDASDLDDSGELNISDPIYSLQFQFAGGPQPQAPYPACGADPTNDALSCASFPPCGGAPAGEEPLPVDESARVRLEIAGAPPLYRVPVVLESGRPLAGFEVSVRFEPRRLEYLGFEEPGQGTDGSVGGILPFTPDFLSARVEDGVLRLGCVPDFELAQPWPAGRYRVVTLRFQDRHPGGGVAPEVAVFGVRLVGADGTAFLPAGGREGASVEAGLDLSGPAQLRIPNPYRVGSPILLAAGETQRAELSIYNVRGQRVRTLFSGTIEREVRSLRWDGRSDHGEEAANGLYYVRATFADHQVSRTILLLR